MAIKVRCRLRENTKFRETEREDGLYRDKNPLSD